MRRERETTKVQPGSKVDTATEHAGTGHQMLPRDGTEELSAVEERERIWAGYDPVRAREALRNSAGALAGVDRGQLLGDIMAQREQGCPE